jgi:hypothetical protein
MRKLFIIFIFLGITNLFAVSEDTKLIIELVKSETKANRDLIKSETKANRDLIISKTEANRDLIIANQKAVDKRFGDINKRFEDMNKRFEDMNKRFEDMQKSVDKRFDDMNKRFDTLVYIITTGFVLLFGYLLKERTVIAKKVKEEIEDEVIQKLEQKTDKTLTLKIIKVLEDLAQNDEETRKLLEKHHLKLA